MTRQSANVYKKGVKLLTTAEAAAKLGISVGRVHQLMQSGRLPGEKKGRDYLIREEDLKLVQDRKPGRPSKSGAASASTSSKRKQTTKS